MGSYFNGKRLREQLRIDEGDINVGLSPKLKNWLPTLYGVSDPQSYTPTLTRRWHVFVLPWYWLVLCALTGSPLLLFGAPKENLAATVLIVVTALVFLVGVTVTVDHPTPRYLTNAAWLVLLMLGAGLQRVRLAARYFRKIGAGLRSNYLGVRNGPAYRRA